MGNESGDKGQGGGSGGSGNGAKAPTIGGLLTALDPFTGAPKECIHTYFDAIERAAIIGQWTDAQRLAIAKLLLKGEAYHYLDANPDIQKETNYDTFKKALIERFEPTEALSRALSNLMSTAQKPHETVDEYATRLKLAGKKAFRKGKDDTETKARKDMLDENMLAQFMRGLHKSIRRQVLSRAPKDLEEAIKTAKDEEQNLKIIEFGYVHQVEAKDYKEIQAATKPRNNQNSPREYQYKRKTQFGTGQFHNRSSGPNRNNAGIANRNSCYACGGMDHFIRQCRQAKCRKCGQKGHIQRDCAKKHPNGQSAM